MEVSAELMKDNINRRGWLLWAATFAVVLALASAVTLLFYPLVRLIQELGGARNSTEGYYAIVGLAGLVLIFCLYVVLKQHELMKTRDALELNERVVDPVGHDLSGTVPPVPANVHVAPRKRALGDRDTLIRSP